MKKVVFCIAALLLSGTLAGAALLLNDSFNYPDGPLVAATGSPWTTYSGTSGQVKVVSGRMFLSKANSEDVHAVLAGQPYGPASNAVLYVSFKINYTNLPSSAGSYFAEFKDGGTGFRARIFAQTAGAASGAFRIGIANAGGSPAAVFNADLQTNTDYTIVARLAVSNVVSTLWLDPTAETNAGVTAADTTSALTITSYGFREDGSSGTIGNFFVDDLRVGTTFSDVVTNAPALERPTLVASPQNQTVTNGGDVAFSVTVAGTPPFNFQWQCNGTNLSGTTSSNLILTGVTFAQAGFYTCLVTNAVGSTLSEPAALSVWCASAPAFSYLTYNCNGNGLTNWGANTQHVLAIGRQVLYLKPDIITFQEIPVTNNCTAQMADFVTAFCPGYYLVTNSMSDGYIHSVILSRFPIISSTSWLHGSDLAPYGYTGSGFTRDLFEAQIAVPGFPQPLHVFVVHLKATSNSAQDDANKRAAEAGAVSNFFATVYLAATNPPPYVLSGDMNEDIIRPGGNYTSGQPIQRLVNSPTGLQLTTPVNPYTASELTISIKTSLDSRFDYILPCAALFTNIVSSQVFRTDLLTPLPPNLFSYDDNSASDHLPVFMVFANPFNQPFRLLSIGVTNQAVSLKWECAANGRYGLEMSSDLTVWTPLASNLTATGADFAFTTNVPEAAKFFRAYRLP